MVTVESVVISVFGALPGLAIGTGLGTAVVRAPTEAGHLRAGAAVGLDGGVSSRSRPSPARSPRSPPPSGRHASTCCQPSPTSRPSPATNVRQRQGRPARPTDPRQRPCRPAPASTPHSNRPFPRGQRVPPPLPEGRSAMTPRTGPGHAGPWRSSPRAFTLCLTVVVVVGLGGTSWASAGERPRRRRGPSPPRRRRSCPP